MGRLSILLVIVVLMGGMAGCVGGGGDGDDGGGSHTLIVDFTPGGTVAVDDLPIPGKAILTYDAGAVVGLNASASAGYRFVEWTGNASRIDDVNAASTTIVIDDDYYITANFIAQYVLTIDSKGGGEVTGPGEGTFAYDAGAVVDLAAEPGEGYKFASWTGDVGTIADTADPETSITMNSDHSITANFQPDWIQNPTNGHYYVLTPYLTWMQAETWAQEWGGHLATLRSWEEELWIKDTFGRNECFWIGFSDIEDEGNWVWSSGEPVVYTNWEEGEPNNCGGFPETGVCSPEDAAVMNWAVDGYGDYWNDLPRIIAAMGVAEFVSDDG